MPTVLSNTCGRVFGATLFIVHRTNKRGSVIRSGIAQEPNPIRKVSVFNKKGGESSSNKASAFGRGTDNRRQDDDDLLVFAQLNKILKSTFIISVIFY